MFNPPRTTEFFISPLGRKKFTDRSCKENCFYFSIWRYSQKTLQNKSNRIENLRGERPLAEFTFSNNLEI